MLATAAAMGRGFDIRELEAVTACSREELLVWLDQARSLRVVVEVAGEVGRFRFSHALVRDHLYDGVAGAERPELHRRIASVLERLHASDIESHLPEIADHFTRVFALAEPLEFRQDFRERRLCLVDGAFREVLALFLEADPVLDELLTEEVGETLTGGTAERNRWGRNVRCETAFQRHFEQVASKSLGPRRPPCKIGVTPVDLTRGWTAGRL